MRKEIRISGFGGQGIVLAGYLVGKALALYQGLEAAMTQSYGPEARGGASASNVVVADRPIDYPFIHSADILIAMSQEAYTRYHSDLKPAGKILIDSGLVTPEVGQSVSGLPATEIAEELGRRIIANVVMLGFLCHSTELIERDALIQSIQTTLPQKAIDLNLTAFERGFSYLHEQEVTA